MTVVLVTGASGSIGRAVTGRLASAHEVISLSRRPPAPGSTWIRSDFTTSTRLSGLASRRVDVVVHLAAETAGNDAACLEVNLIGTLRFLEDMIHRGTRRFVLASSIAAVGCLSPDFRPRELPMGDDYPGEATDSYGFSKAMMEEAARLVARRHPDVEVLVLRIGTVVDGAASASRPGSASTTIAGHATVPMTDVVDLISRAVDGPVRPGATQLNVVGPAGGPDGASTEYFSRDRLRAFLDMSSRAER